MNTNHTHQIRTATLATVIAFVAFAGTTAPAFATHTHDDGEGGAGTTALPPYAVPIDGSRRDDVGGVHRGSPRRRPPHPHRGVTRPACPEQDTAPDIGRGPCYRSALWCPGAQPEQAGASSDTHTSSVWDASNARIDSG